MSSNPYPYPVEDGNHKHAWVLFNVPDAPRFDLDTANAVCAHLERLGVDLTPETTHDSEIIYDALGGVGAPWENGVWQAADKPRMEFTTTIPAVDVTAMSEAQRAELKLALDMADIADASDANPHRKSDN